MSNVGSWWLWIGFSIFLVIAFTIDILFQSRRHALLWTGIWVGAALLFNGLLWLVLFYTRTKAIANQAGINFFTAYVIEKSLSIDNLFAFYLVFQQLRIPPNAQHRVFSYGIIGAVMMRLGLILVGSILVQDFHWILYIMGAFLLFMGVKMLLNAGQPIVPLGETWLFNTITRYFRVTPEIVDQHFFIKRKNLLYATPLLIALVFVEINDLIFALDSIPAVFSITTDPFIVWTSNVFSILGLRALYFKIADAATRFQLLKYGIALIIVFVGIKILLTPWLSISIVTSLGIIAGILLFFISLSHYVQYRKGC